MGYEELANKIKDILGKDTDVDTLPDADVDGLVEYDLGFTAKDAGAFKFLRSMRNRNKAKKMLVIPDLPADRTLTLPEFQKFKSEGTKVELILPGDASKIDSGSIEYSDLDAGDWLKVAINCNILHAHTFSKLGESNDTSFNPIFLPPNRSLYNTNSFKPSRESLSYHAEAQKFENYSAKSVMTDIGGGISFQTPWVSGSVEYSHQTKHRTMEKGTKVKSMCKIEFPIGTITLPNPYEASLSTSDFKLNEDIIKYVEFLLSKTPKIEKQQFCKELCKEYGDLVPRYITIGVACYTTKTGETKESQTLDEVSDHFKTSIKGVYEGMGGELKSHADVTKTTETGKKSESSSFQFTAIAGSLPDPNNPVSIAQYRLKPGSWRTINFGKEFTPVIKYLSKDVQAKLEELPGKWPRRIDPVFDNFNEDSWYQVKGAADVSEVGGRFLVPKIQQLTSAYKIIVKERINKDEVAVAFKFKLSGDLIYLAMRFDELDNNGKYPTVFILEKCDDGTDGLVYIKHKNSDSDLPQYLHEVDSGWVFKLSSAVSDRQKFLIKIQE